MAAFKLHETKGNIFHMPQAFSLAHAVSADLNNVPGSIAWQFAVLFGSVDERNKQQICSGSAALLEENGRFIYFLVTKDTLYEQTRYDVLRLALICMREHMRSHGILKLAMPKICCGADGLRWHTVRDLILQVFAHEYNVEIVVCDYKPPVKPRCEITEVKGNLFTAPDNYSLVHSVSADFAMNAGVGLLFKHKFGQVKELLKQNKHTGNVAVIRDNDRYIYNLVTKERNHEKCTYPALFYALLAMRDHMNQHHVTKLAIPRIGCGIDRLSWLKVKRILELVFADDKIEIIAYYRPETRAQPITSSFQSLSLQSVE